MSLAEPSAGRPLSSLRELAREAIEFGLREGRELAPDPSRYAPELRARGASFVTLRRGGELRGCTGSLEAVRPLLEDVTRNAWRSASADPRFLPLRSSELGDLEVSVSVLSPLEPFPVASEEALLARLRPGVDGLLLCEGGRRATFLPSVWESLPEPRDFLDALRQKAGLPRGHWSAALRFERYTTRDAD